MKTTDVMCFRENNNGGIKQAQKQACECYIFHDENNLIRGAPNGLDFTTGDQCCLWWKLSLIYGNQHSQHPKKYKRQTSKQDTTQDEKQQKIQGSNRSTDREIELINKNVQYKTLIDI